MAARAAGHRGNDMPVIGIDHVQLAMPVGGEERARGFYRDVLGLPERPKPPALAKRGGCWFENESVRIHLGVDEEFRAATKAHPALLVRELRAIVEACRAGGFPVTSGEPLPGYRRVYVRDPFGNRIELMERTEA
jgi:catechol 2,3-dioxygenase-like lactoylglutathione lyase family enzyme